MTDTQSPGPGYWKASDGNWYPPAAPVEAKKKRTHPIAWVALAVLLLGFCSAYYGADDNKPESPAFRQAREECVLEGALDRTGRRSSDAINDCLMRRKRAGDF